jgi:hypothetical protein
MKRIIVALGLLAAVLLVTPLGAQESGNAKSDREAKPEDTSFWMRKKLEYSGRILEGLSKEDYAEIGKAARSMRALTHMERWVRAGMPEYRTQLRNFERANDQLIRHADEEQLDGAALAYVQLTLSCVDCHKVIRAPATEAGAPKQ